MQVTKTDQCFIKSTVKRDPSLVPPSFCYSFYYSFYYIVTQTRVGADAETSIMITEY